MDVALLYPVEYFNNFSILFHLIWPTFDEHVVHKSVVSGSSMIGFLLVIAVSAQDMPGIEPGPLGWQTSALTNELQ